MDDQQALRDTLDSLNSPAALAQINEDPYWPKWDSPWWRMLLLHELGKTEWIPQAAAEALAEKIDSACLHFFPHTEEELPPDTDGWRDIICHCALGSILQVFHARGLDIVQRYPWLAAWFRDNHLPDGGYNCSDDAYRGSRKSSVASTLPMLELLLQVPRLLEAEQRKAIITTGMNYLRQRNLVYSLSDPTRVMDKDFLIPTFPRYYHYDILRGLRFMVHASREFPGLVSSAEWDAWFRLTRDCLANIAPNPTLDTVTIFPVNGQWIDSTSGEHHTRPVSFFPLLDHFRDTENITRRVHAEYDWCCQNRVG